MSDYGNVIELLEKHEISEDRRTALEEEGYRSALGRIIPHKVRVASIAERLLESGSVSAVDFEHLTRA